MNELREKLFEIILDSVIKEAVKASHLGSQILLRGPHDAFDQAIYDLMPCEWTKLSTRWKARLKRLGITRTTCKYLRSTSFMDEPRTNTLPGRNLPGFYSIIDPLTTSERARNICFLDLPTELGDKILVLGEFPTK